MHRLRQRRGGARDLREGVLIPSRWRPRLAPSALGAAAAAALLLWLAGCSPDGHGSSASAPETARGAKTVSAAPAEQPKKAEPASGRWYAFSGGRTVAVDGPAATGRAFEPWTVQTRASGFLSIGDTLFIALNGWGVLTLPVGEDGSVGGGANAPRSFRSYTDRGIFGGRTINGFTTDGRRILLHLYRNTVFSTARPQSSPVAYVRFDPPVGKFSPVALPPSLEGWEAVEVVETSKGRWAIAWKKTGAERVEFRYALYDPRSGKSREIDRKGFVAAYDFTEIRNAPAAVRQLAGVAAAMEYEPSSALAGPRDEVLHILLRGRPFARTERFREGPEKELEAGDASLATLPAIRVGKRVYALLHSGRLLRSGREGTTEAPRVASLPQLPSDYVYTKFWTDGRLLVAAWERQRFAEVGAAGIYLVPIDGLRWSSAG